MEKKEGLLFCLVGAAGSGKTSLGKELLNRFSSPRSLVKSITATSRAPREGEQEGVDYFFHSKDEFEERIKSGDFFEWEETHGNYYGTLRSSIEQSVSDGVDLLLDIDIRGAFSFRNAYPSSTVIVFLAPPSQTVLVERIKNRGFISDKELKTRLLSCEREYETVLKSHGEDKSPDYMIVNDDFEESLGMLEALVKIERVRFKRQSKQSLERLLKIEQE